MIFMFRNPTALRIPQWKNQFDSTVTSSNLVKQEIFPISLGGLRSRFLLQLWDLNAGGQQGQKDRRKHHTIEDKQKRKR